MSFALGRHKEHDEASRLFPAHRAPALRSVQHEHVGPVLDQGNLGSCTGNAMAQALNTVPLRDGVLAHRPGLALLDENDAVAIYSWATHHDRIPGVWPPTDTGSSGLAVAKAAKHLGLISRYHHAFGLAHALGALVVTPVIIGIPWYESMFEPDASGMLNIDGQIAGGHEVCLTGLSCEDETVTLLNSWSDGWGVGGFARLSWSDLDALLADGGDCTVPVP